MKDKLGGKLMTGFAALRPKRCSYLSNRNDENIKAKSTRKCIR